MSDQHLFKPDHSSTVRFDVSPETAGWKYLSFRVVGLEAGESFSSHFDDQETAVVPLRGTGSAVTGDQSGDISRSDVFDQMPRVVYAPPGTSVEVTAADGPFEFAIGSAPAEGLYPARIIEPADMKSEVRGGGAALRQVNHVLAPPIDAERLILPF